jgi:hypothetical protein
LFALRYKRTRVIYCSGEFKCEIVTRHSHLRNGNIHSVDVYKCISSENNDCKNLAFVTVIQDT